MPALSPVPRPTLKDVSARAGVSVATASAVANGADWVSDPTRRRVEAAIRALDYRPNRAARALRTRRDETVGVVVGSLADPFQAAVVRALSHALRAGDQSLFLCDADGDAALGDAHLDALVERRVGGLVLVGGTASPGRLAALAERGPAAVVVGAETPGLPAVGPDLEAGAAEAVAYLVARGARRIALAVEPGASAEALRAGWRRASPAGSDELAPDIEPGLDTLLALRPDAVLAGSDALAVRVLGALAAAGRAVPAEVQVVGVGDEPVARLVTPALTSVALRPEAVAEAALAALDGGGSLRLLPTVLAARASTRP